MSEKLSAFVEENRNNSLEDSRQNETNSLLDQREALIADGKSKDDPEVLALSQRLMEMTEPAAAKRYAELESLLSSIPEKVENLSEGLEFIKEQQKDIITLRGRLYELFPDLDEKAKSYINGKIDKFDAEYRLFQAKVDIFPNKDDITLVRDAFEKDFNYWFKRLFDLFEETFANTSKE